MTVPQILVTFLFVIVLGSFIGITLRSFQEGFSPRTYFTAVFIAVLIVPFCLLLPIIVPVMILRDEDIKTRRSLERFLFLVLSIPGSVVFLVPALIKGIERIWQGLEDMDKEEKLALLKVNKRIKVTTTERKSLLQEISGLLQLSPLKDIRERIAH